MNIAVKSILLLGEIPETLISFFNNRTEKVLTTSNPVDPQFIMSNQVDFIVSYRYRHIIRPNIIALLPERIINLHISRLPWNRGADPNLWSFLENTPKGVTIHLVDAGLDTGDILIQKEYEFEDHETLASTYDKLNRGILQLLLENWDTILKQELTPVPQDLNGGSMHRLKDKEPYLHLMAENGWDTPVGSLKGMALP